MRLVKYLNRPGESLDEMMARLGHFGVLIDSQVA